MIIAQMVMFLIGTALMAGPVQDTFAEDRIDDSSPADIFDYSDDQIIKKIPDLHLPLVTYLRIIGLRLVMAYYDFTDWLSIKRDSLLISLKGIFGGSSTSPLQL